MTDAARKVCDEALALPVPERARLAVQLLEGLVEEGNDAPDLLRLDRYVSGECAEVWAELMALRGHVRLPDQQRDAWAVACETMRRVRANIETLHGRLLAIGYKFSHPEAAYVPPTFDISDRIANVEETFGPLPLSLRAFYQIVGSIDFRQSSDQRIGQFHPERKHASELNLLGEEDPLN